MLRREFVTSHLRVCRVEVSGTDRHRVKRMERAGRSKLGEVGCKSDNALCKALALEFNVPAILVGTRKVSLS